MENEAKTTLLSVKAVSERLGFEPYQVYYFAKKGYLTPCRFGRILMFRWETVLKNLEDLEKAGVHGNIKKPGAKLRIL